MRDDDIPIRCEMMKTQLGNIGVGDLNLDKLFYEMYKEHANCTLRFYCLAFYLKKMGFSKDKLLGFLMGLWGNCPRFKEEGISWSIKTSGGR